MLLIRLNFYWNWDIPLVKYVKSPPAGSIEKHMWHQAQESMNRAVMHHMTAIFHAALVVQYSALARSITCIYMQINSRGPEQEREGQLINESFSWHCHPCHWLRLQKREQKCHVTYCGGRKKTSIRNRAWSKREKLWRSFSFPDWNAHCMRKLSGFYFPLVQGSSKQFEFHIKLCNTVVNSPS